MKQLDLIPNPEGKIPGSSAPYDFDGKTYEPESDQKRLGKQANAVWEYMKDGKIRTPKEMEQKTGYNWSSINARLRDFRKDKFGSHTVNRRRLGKGLFDYQLVPRERE